MTKDIPQASPNITPGTYDAATVERAMGILPPELQMAVAEGLRVASQERKRDHEVLQLQTTIAEFAVAFHLILANSDDDYKADLINWDRLTYFTAEAIIEYYTPELGDRMPDSVRKAVAYFYAGAEFMRDASREEVDEVLEPFGYPTSRILDDLVSGSIEAGNKNSPEYIREQLDKVVERIDLQSDYPELERQIRQDLLALGYQLPELEEDKSYGHCEEGGDSYPRFTANMLPV